MNVSQEGSEGDGTLVIGRCRDAEPSPPILGQLPGAPDFTDSDEAVRRVHMPHGWLGDRSPDRLRFATGAGSSNGGQPLVSRIGSTGSTGSSVFRVTAASFTPEAAVLDAGCRGSNSSPFERANSDNGDRGGAAYTSESSEIRPGWSSQALQEVKGIGTSLKRSITWLRRAPISPKLPPQHNLERTTSEGANLFETERSDQSNDQTIMTGGAKQLKVMELAHQGTESSLHVVETGESNLNQAPPPMAQAASFWRGRHTQSPTGEEGHIKGANYSSGNDFGGHRCLIPVFSFIVSFAALVSAAFSACTVILLEELIASGDIDSSQVKDTRLRTYIALSVLSLITIAAAVIQGLALSRTLSRLEARMTSIGFETEEYMSESNYSKPSKFADINRLQQALARLQSNITTFECFLPETVVRGILAGEVKAQRLHVSKREVSVMFSDIKDFTNISEALQPKDILLMLTRYLDIASRIADGFEGVVAEILGDGLLVYWNTPDLVEDHCVKAASTALAHQRALRPLNAELAGLGLPKISIRVGLHTGKVLTGNIGSLTKMKFGCMGDAVNLASRLEGLCKLYQVSIVCSGELHEHLDEDVFFCRKLDVVRVKGKTTPTEVYQVIGLHKGGVTGGAFMGQTYTAASAADSLAAAPAELRGIDAAVNQAIQASSRIMNNVQVSGMSWMNYGIRNASSVLRRSATSCLVDLTEKVAAIAAVSPGGQNITSEGSGISPRPLASPHHPDVHFEEDAPCGNAGASRPSGSSPDPTPNFLTPGVSPMPSETPSNSRRRDRKDTPPPAMPARRKSRTDIEPMMLSLAGTVRPEARKRVGMYETALQLFQEAKFVEARDTLQELMGLENCPFDAAAELLLKRTNNYIGPDGISVVNLTDDELDSWEGIHNLDEK